MIPEQMPEAIVAWRNPDELRLGQKEEYKYIVAEVTFGGSSTRVVRAEPYQDEEDGSALQHWQILGRLQKEVSAITTATRVGVLGGGFMLVRGEETKGKTVLVYHSSHEYGEEPDRAETVRQLAEAYPRYRFWT